MQAEGEYSDALAIVRRVYDSVPCSITPLSGYDDLNFMVEFAATTDLAGTAGGRYVMKIVNEVDSSRIGLTKSIITVLFRLPEMSLQVPRPVPCSNGGLVDQVELEDVIRNVIMLTFVEGLDHKMLMLKEETFLKLCEKIGECGGLLLKNLSDVETGDIATVLKRTEDRYMLRNLHYWREKLDIVGVGKVREYCSYIMDLVEGWAETPPDLREGVIHNDLCIENLVFCKSFDGQYDVTGAIDFSDMTYSFYVFEVAIPIASAMYQTYVLKLTPPEGAAKAVLKGFENLFYLTRLEKKFLYYAVMARFVSLRVIGGYDILRSSKTADHEEHNAESLEYFIETLSEDGNEKWCKVFGID